jgi:predicted nuclease of restriction endonuclease-like (RecB) superfamily
MSKTIKKDNAYISWIKDISLRYKKSQIKAATKVNAEMLQFYWTLGHDIHIRKASAQYGDNFFKQLSLDLQAELPDVKSFSQSNLRYMMRFYLLYKDLIFPQLGEETSSQIFPQPGEDLFSVPWGHHKYIIDKFSNNPQKALFYVHKTIENEWSRAMLLNFLDTDIYERQGKAISNFSLTLPNPQSDLAQELTKDPYNFDFISLSEKYKEKELKEALEKSIARFLLELGTGFAYMGKEYRILIGNTEKFIDMLFYNIKLRCYVVVEIKTEAFDSAHIGQLGTYVSAVNHKIKSRDDAPTIGILICKTKDNVLAQYALESSSQPIGISEYELSKLYPADFKGTLPSIDELEKGLSE